MTYRNYRLPDMRILLLFIFSLLVTVLRAQDTTRVDSASFIDIKTNASFDTARDAYGDLLNDDPVYNRRYKWYIPATRVIMANVLDWASAKYVFKYDWPATSISDWKRNLREGWEWDADKFGTNFIGHPHSGNYYFNLGRSNGYSFWGSLPFAIERSLTWEYFGENTRPSINDFINTPISGMFLGEVAYRISSNILDDRTRGAERV